MSVTLTTVLNYQKPAGSLEMLNNPGFDSSDYWTLAGSISIGSGICSWANNTGSLIQTNANMARPILNSTSYTLSFDITMASGSRYIYITDASQSVEYVAGYQTITGSQRVSYTFTTVSDIESVGAGLKIYDASDDPWSIDNISLKAN